MHIYSFALKDKRNNSSGARSPPHAQIFVSNAYLQKEKPKLPGEMTDSRTGPGSMQDKRGWSLLQCQEARKFPNRTMRAHTDGACQRGQGPHREPHGWNGLCHKSSKVILGYNSSVD